MLFLTRNGNPKQISSLKYQEMGFKEGDILTLTPRKARVCRGVS
jgi:hypothetical protein